MSPVLGYGRRLVGDRFEVVPEQSAFGCLARLARLNQLGPGDMHRMFDLRVRRAEDLLLRLSLSDRQQVALAASLGLDPPLGWQPQPWHPFSGGPRALALTTFRYCTGFIRVGYHCLGHHLPWFERRSEEDTSELQFLMHHY